MSVDTATVAKIAALARIRMSEAELDGDGARTQRHPRLGRAARRGRRDRRRADDRGDPQQLRLRDDVVDADPLTGGGIRDAVLANAPAAEHGFFGVPKVIE